MFVDRLVQFEKLLGRFDSPALRLTIDIGHLHCQGELPIAEQIRRWSDRLVNVHIEDMRAGVHEHLMFGEGEIDFPPALAALAESDYAGLVQVELSRHSHMGPQAALTGAGVLGAADAPGRDDKKTARGVIRAVRKLSNIHRRPAGVPTF